jgi:hypothetical protein
MPHRLRAKIGMAACDGCGDEDVAFIDFTDRRGCDYAVDLR